MSNFLTVNLKLSGQPREIKTKTGTPMTTGYGFAKLGNDSPDLAISVVAFHDVASELAHYSKGDVINLAGQLKMNLYEKDGEQKEQLQIVADGIAGKMALKQVKRQQKAQHKPQQKKVASKDNHQASVDFQDSALPF